MTMGKISCVWALLALLASVGWAVERPVTHQGFLDPTQISLEDLLQIEVISHHKKARESYRGRCRHLCDHAGRYPALRRH